MSNQTGEFTASIGLATSINLTTSQTIPGAVTIAALPTSETFSFTCTVVDTTSTPGAEIQDVSLTADVVLPATESLASLRGQITFWLGPYSPVISPLTLTSTTWNDIAGVASGVVAVQSHDQSTTHLTSATPTSASTSATTTATQDPGSSPSSDLSKQSEELGPGAKIGVGCGPLVFRRKRLHRKQKSNTASGYEKQELYGRPLPRTHGRAELNDATAKHELLSDDQIERMPRVPVELE
ncbi:hypothetical protein EDD37DRAFT_678641 [Exophiala viscosa]|uniref:uncharacterized protein n=1 Tax=Exophiala viscosa TaxID=2486360 RepID=UPI00219E8C61|nr:hypothetical protein EDD37DRAFT_678641 [Exophiala viscosa]